MAAPQLNEAEPDLRYLIPFKKKRRERKREKEREPLFFGRHLFFFSSLFFFFFCPADYLINGTVRAVFFFFNQSVPFVSSFT